MRRASPKLALFLIGVMVAGCVAKTHFVSEGTRPKTSQGRVLLMPSDIELYILKAGGMLEPKADWTETARSQVAAALKEELRTKDMELVLYQKPIDMPSKDYAHNQLLKLHGAVGGAILVHKYVPRFQLPTKKDKFDWSLGQGVHGLADEYDAQYGLFIHLRDSYASGGRVTFMILTAIVTMGRFVPHGGAQLGFASLVDLRSGEIIWFNRLLRGTGDLRTLEPAREAVKELLTGIPL